jgi:hypothetical protein
MTNDLDAILDDILMRWHQWTPPIRCSRGFNRQATGMEQYVTSRQYDDQNGALDDAIERQTMEAVQREIERMLILHQIALKVNARALTLGVVVFNHPRLPQDREQRQLVIRTARGDLTCRLSRAGIL